VAVDLFWWLLSFFAGGVGTAAIVPEELLLVGAGIWAAQKEIIEQFGQWRWLVLPAAVLGILIADCCLYLVGRHFGARLLRNRWSAHFLPQHKRERIERNFKRYGVWILLFGRLLPAIRGPLFVTAGMMRVRGRKFLLADALGAVLGNSLLFFLAVWFGHSFENLINALRKDADTVKHALIFVGVVLAGVYLLIHFLRRPVSEGAPDELPLIGPQVAAHIEHHESKHPLPTIEPLHIPEHRHAVQGPAHDRSADCA
jgi:membrane protein DedA with SNARE-associated domain